jgi:hypothetical protein
LQADWSCQRSDGRDCAACIADAFERVERECPFSREAFFFGRNCTLRLGEYSILGSDVFGKCICISCLATDEKTSILTCVFTKY